MVGIISVVIGGHFGGGDHFGGGTGSQKIVAISLNIGKSKELTSSKGLHMAVTFI